MSAQSYRGDIAEWFINYKNFAVFDRKWRKNLSSTDVYTHRQRRYGRVFHNISVSKYLIMNFYE